MQTLHFSGLLVRLANKRWIEKALGNIAFHSFWLLRRHNETFQWTIGGRNNLSEWNELLLFNQEIDSQRKHFG